MVFVASGGGGWPTKMSSTSGVCSLLGGGYGRAVMKAAENMGEGRTGILVTQCIRLMQRRDRVGWLHRECRCLNGQL